MGQKFVKVPKMWQVCLAEKRAGASTYRLALYLLDKSTFSEEVPLRNGALKGQGVGRRTKWRALEQFRQFGLIAVETRPGKPPLVKVRWTK